jgi:hypothetical protein
MRLHRAIAAILLCASMAAAQTCGSGPNAHAVAEFGAFVATASDSATIAANNATINAAVRSVGQAGGGTICLPAGTFYIGPNPRVSDVAVEIGYDNITIRGAGMDSTILRTNGTYAIVGGQVRRGHGIIIRGTSNCASPRRNIVLRDFQLDGQAGWTGQYGWPADTATGAGWDISHKGIVPAWDACVDSVTLENLYVHHYRGEILYVGGMGMGHLTVRNVRAENTNGSDFNLYAAALLVENCTFGGPSRFWMELSARANQGGYPENRAVFRHNVYRDAVGATAIVMCQGDFQPYAFVFDSNTISNCPGAFAAYGGVAGPVTITNNTISNCGTVLEFGQAPGWINSNASANITMEGNTITGGGLLVSFYATQRNITVHNNDFTGKSSTDLGQSTAVFYGAADLLNTRIEANVLRNCRTPEQTAGITGTRPLFVNNTYQNVERRWGQGLSWVNPGTPLATPKFEEVTMGTDTANTVAALERTLYPDSQVIRVTGGSTQKPIVFATGQASYSVAQQRVLNGSSAIWLRFDSTQAKWIETTPSAASGPARPRAAAGIAVVGGTFAWGRTVAISMTPPSRLRVSLYALDGRLVRVLADETLVSGAYELRLPARQRPLSSSCRVLLIEAGAERLAQRMPL